MANFDEAERTAGKNGLHTFREPGDGRGMPQVPNALRWRDVSLCVRQIAPRMSKYSHISTSLRQRRSCLRSAAGGSPNDPRNSCVICDWLAKPQAAAMSVRGNELGSI